MAAIRNAVCGRRRKLDLHLRPRPRSRRHEYLRPMLFRDPLRDREPETSPFGRTAAVRPRPRRIASVEPLEDSRQLLRPDSYPRVRHNQCGQPARPDPHGDSNDATGRRELDRVVEQDESELPQQLGIADHRRFLELRAPRGVLPFARRSRGPRQRHRGRRRRGTRGLVAMGRCPASARASVSRSSTMRPRRIDSRSMPCSASTYSSAERERWSATSARLRTTVSGVRSSWAASAMKRRICSIDRSTGAADWRATIQPPMATRIAAMTLAAANSAMSVV